MASSIVARTDLPRFRGWSCKRPAAAPECHQAGFYRISSVTYSCKPRKDQRRHVVPANLESAGPQNSDGSVYSGRITSIDSEQNKVPSQLSVTVPEVDIHFDNHEIPGATKMEISRLNVEHLLTDVMASLIEMGISVKTAQITSDHGSYVGRFILVEAETDLAIPEEKFEILKKKILNRFTQQGQDKQGGDAMLDEQVSFLTSTLDKVVCEHGQADMIEAVRTLQTGFEQLAVEEDPRKRAELLRYIDNMEEPLMTAVIRVFYLYSSLLNIADEAHSHRRRREQVWASKKDIPLWYASFDHTFRLFRQAGVSSDELQKLLKKMKYNPVFTAHPTEARRREILTCLHRMFDLCNARKDPRLSPAQKARIETELEAEIEILWRTDEMRTKKPTVLEEIETGLDYFRLSIFDAVCTTYRYAENSLSHVYPNSGVTIPSFIKFGTWIGGDRDGNPYVLPETTLMAALLQSRLMLAEYIRRCRACQDMLTHSSLISEVPNELLDSLKGEKILLERIPSLRHAGGLYELEPYRLKFRIMRHRLEQNLRIINSRLRELAAKGNHYEVLIDIDYNIEEIPGLNPEEDAYHNEKHFLRDLRLIDSSLRKQGDLRLADSKLKDMVRLAETFGFHLCALDVRQESTVHSEATHECMRLLGISQDYNTLSEEEKMKKLVDAISNTPPSDKIGALMDTMSESTKKVIEVFCACADIMATISQQAVASYVISMTRRASHVLEVLFLAWVSCKNIIEKQASGRWSSRLIITPLFETIPDLQHMPVALATLLEENTYKEIIRASGGVQEVMLGYSDSCKDGGIAASAFGLYKAQEVIQKITSEAGIKSRIFHGRGGTLGRGAGPTHESVLGQPPGSIDGQIKFTEQGEVITYRYGNAETATYELSVGITGVLKASHPAIRPGRTDNSKYYPTMEKIAAVAEKHYRQLTDDTEGFYDYFYECTIVNEIGLVNMGSRPSRRKATVRDKTSLRAIPWVFGWGQSRHTLPAWYGVGTGIEAYTNNDPELLEELRNMYNDWPFFRTFLSNVQMSLFKASMEIAQEYARLCSNRITEKLVYDLISREYYLTKSQFLLVSQNQELLDDNPQLKVALNSRRKYLDPLNHFQVILLGRRRDPMASTEDKSLWEKPLLRTIKAIASNMRNTG